MKLYNMDWIQKLYYEEMLRNNTEKSHDEHGRDDQSTEKNRKGNQRLSRQLQTPKTECKNNSNGRH